MLDWMIIMWKFVLMIRTKINDTSCLCVFLFIIYFIIKMEWKTSYNVLVESFLFIVHNKNTIHGVCAYRHMNTNILTKLVLIVAR